MGLAPGVKSMNLAIEKAKRYGISSAAVRNPAPFGIDGYYTLMTVRADMIGMSFTNTRPAVAPTFSTQPALGTYPIAFSAPTDEEFPQINPNLQIELLFIGKELGLQQYKFTF